MTGPTQWETFQGGDATAEHARFQQLAEQIMAVQVKNRRFRARHEADPPVSHAFHAKTTFAVNHATLTLREELPGGLTPQPGRVIVRFSNASGTVQPDGSPDLRGVSLRIPVEDAGGAVHRIDWLLTNFPVSHARDATEFVRFAVATAGGPVAKAIGIAGLPFRVGLRPTWRMIRNIRASRRRTDSVVTESYYSRGALLWGERPVRLMLLAARTPPGPEPDRTNPDFLFRDAKDRLEAGDITFDLAIHRYTDERTTPIEDTSIPWRQTVPDQIRTVGTLTIPRMAAGHRWFGHATDPAITSIDFNPWNTTEQFRPLGNLNRARKAAYDASAAHRHHYRFPRATPWWNILFGGLLRSGFGVLNRRVPWHRLPTPVALLNLQAIRQTLFRHNLIDTEPDAPPTVRDAPEPPPDAARIARTADGSFTDLSVPGMGAVGATFGRNMPVAADVATDPPNPITVSRILLERTVFRPATSLNLLAAAWIQFQVHDWVNHERLPLRQDDIVVPLPPGEPRWANIDGAAGEGAMHIAGDQPPSRIRSDPTALENTATFWWDASEIYGSTLERQRALRHGHAKLALGPDGFLPSDCRGDVSKGFNDGWWLGLSLMHTLFTREHNLICDRLEAVYPGWPPERTYQTARLIVSALMAKIQTLEWTPTALAHPAIAIGMDANWSGPRADDRLTRFFTWLIDAPALKGIPATFPYHYRTPYALTEEFTTVYRMHPLIPDDYTLLDRRNGGRHELSFNDIAGTNADRALARFGLDDAVYSFAVAHPGAITLHNYPHHLRRFTRDNGEVVDLAVADLVRNRRRGVPRYNDFRAALHMPRVRSFEELSTESAGLLSEVYNGNIDAVDTMIGLFAEAPPAGFAFSDTAFRIFVMTATRRIQSDRFLTVDFRPGVYSEFGMDWIANTDMAAIIDRHCPSLSALLPRDRKVFAPWRPAGSW